MSPWMKRRIEHARARCEKTTGPQKQQTESKRDEKLQDKQPAKTSNKSR